MLPSTSAFVAPGPLPLRAAQPARLRLQPRRVAAAQPARTGGSSRGNRAQPPRMAADAETFEAPQTRRLSDALKERDVEARKEREAAERRQREKEEKKLARQRKIDQLNSIPDDTEVGTIGEYMYDTGVKDTLEALDRDLVGLKPVKARCAEVASLLILDTLRKKLELATAVPSLHMCFTGSPGTGKTTLAVRMGEILKKMGYCRSGHLVVATRDDLVGQYVGHTAPRTKEVIKKAFGGVLLIDEAYYLYNASNDRDYGQESIEILLQVMEHQSDDIVIILAGYEDRMNKFFSYIPGMSSRIGNHINFPDYKSDELLQIAQVMTKSLEYEFAPGAEDVFLKYIEKRMEMPYFSNARTVRNAVDRARMRASIRLFNAAMGKEGNGMVSRKDLQLILPEDLVSVEELVSRGDRAIVE
jgi:probable Rubsico expression protein CbbX